VFIAVLQPHRAGWVDEQNECDVKAGHPEIVSYALRVAAVQSSRNDRICRV
jgi:hypothetical protein